MASTTFKPGTKNEPMEQVKQAGNEAFDKVKDAGSQAYEKAKDVGNQAMDKAKDTVGSVGDMARSAAERVGEKANDYTAAAGHELKAAGENIARRLPHDGMAGQAGQAIAETIQQGGRYLEDTKLSGMAGDLTDVIKTHPIPTMLICLGLGFCIGRAMRD